MKFVVALMISMALVACNGDSPAAEPKKKAGFSAEELAEVVAPDAIYKLARERAKIEITIDNAHERLAEIERAVARSKDPRR